MEAFAQGADGVLVGGCHMGDCHYKTGNHKTARRMKVLTKLLEDSGFDSRRFRLEWISGAEGYRFAEVVEEFTKDLVELGPNPLKKGA